MKRRTIAAVKTRVCDVTGLERPESDFYKNQSHLIPLRLTSSAPLRNTDSKV